MNTQTDNLTKAFYFGLPVEVVYKMETCSWVRFSGQDLIVDTDDLAPAQGIQPGLTRPLSPERLCPKPVRFLHAGVATTR